MLPILIGTENIDRLLVIITEPNVELLGVPYMLFGTRKEIASGVYGTLK